MEPLMEEEEENQLALVVIPETSAAIRACGPCRRAKTACDETRPCPRCTRLNIVCCSADAKPKKTACVNCHRAKSACDGGPPCGRCTRLGVECRLPESKKTGKRKHAPQTHHYVKRQQTAAPEILRTLPPVPAQPDAQPTPASSPSPPPPPLTVHNDANSTPSSAKPPWTDLKSGSADDTPTSRVCHDVTFPSPMIALSPALTSFSPMLMGSMLSPTFSPAFTFLPPEVMASPSSTPSTWSKLLDERDFNPAAALTTASQPPATVHRLSSVETPLPSCSPQVRPAVLTNSMSILSCMSPSVMLSSTTKFSASTAAASSSSATATVKEAKAEATAASSSQSSSKKIH